MKPQGNPLFLLSFGLVILALAACTPTPVCAPTYTVTKTSDTNDGVCSGGDCSLREAVLNANACPGAHTINLPAGGYTLTLDGDDEDLGETGDLDITGELTIIGTGAPSIHGGIERSFQIHSGAVVVLDHIWLADGSAIYGGGLVNEGTTTLESFTCNYNTVAIPPGGMGDAMGGCIFNTGDLTIRGGQFLANTAGFGGAIYNYDSATLTIESADFTGNAADTHGGAIWNGPNATLDFTGGSLRLNEAGLHGGGLWNNGSLEGSNLTFEENAAVGQGGGLFNWHAGFAVLRNSFLTLNTADQGGGAFNSEGMLHFYESALTANTASGGSGGGVFNMGPAPGAGLLMNNVTLSGNSAPGGLGGAGIYNTSNLMLTFITVANNSPEGIRVDGGAEIKIRSSALANNPGGNCAGIPLDSLGHNIDSDGSCAFAGWDDLPATDPLLEPLAFYAGIAPSHALGPGSPALDSGDPDMCTAIDQQGTSRPQGAWCDRGAHENIYSKGILRGWTYIDENDNSLRDPGEGFVTGALIALKEGACPGGTQLSVAESDSSGFYEILDIDPGAYCLEPSPLQQAADPLTMDITLGAGDVLEELNFRYMVLAADSSINGLVWHDLCAVPYETTSEVPDGCVALPGGGFEANGIYEPGEPGIPGVEVKLSSGPCPFSLVLSSTLTDPSGEYGFPTLVGGTYCLMVDALAAPNDTILLPGGWTYPVSGVNPAENEVVLGLSEELTDINFGWDYQFLPEPSSSSGSFSKNGFCREGPSTLFGTVTGFEKGRQFTILARSENHLPLWFYIEDLILKIRCWISESVAIYQIKPELIPTRIAPPPPTATPTPPPCSRDLDRTMCEAAGGSWTEPNLTTGYSDYCTCP